MPNYDDLAQALASEGAAFGVFPQMGGKRRLQDAEAAKNIPIDILGGIVSSGLGAIPSGIKLLSDIRKAGRDDRPSAEIPGGIDYWLDKMPLKGEAPVNKAAAQLGSMLPINPAPAYRALGNVGKATTSLLGNELARGMYGNEGSLANVIPSSMKPRFATEPIKNFESNLVPDKDLDLLQKELLKYLTIKNAGLGEFATTNPKEILKATKQGGYSVNLTTGKTPEEGIMMGRYANTDPRNFVIPETRNLTQQDIIDFAKTNKKALQNPENNLGTWLDPDTGKVYLDTSKKFEPEQIRQATKFGEKTGQLAGYNVGEGQSIPVGNWKNFIESPEFIGSKGRLAQMEKVGRDYLSQYPTSNWWDIRGSNMENVYGKQNLPQVAGFTAATAPVSAPRENIQTMSEYMRRHIKGEPILQPDWRVPPGMMTRSEGVQIGMEGSRANNLVKSGRGDYANLSGKKVGEEGRALMGDPNAVVLDRHQIRVSEDPSRGIYASGSPDIISPEQYDSLKNAITIYAQNHSTKNPNMASADIWTGIRETIKNKSNLFGTKFQGSAVTGDSKSYIDHFNDLIKDKAQHLGISIKEMETKLKNGDANLMSYVLASPLAYEAFDQWKGQQAND